MFLVLTKRKTGSVDEMRPILVYKAREFGETLSIFFSFQLLRPSRSYLEPLERSASLSMALYGKRELAIHFVTSLSILK